MVITIYTTNIETKFWRLWQFVCGILLSVFLEFIIESSVALEWLSLSSGVEGDLQEWALRSLRLTLSRASRTKDVVTEARRSC